MGNFINAISSEASLVASVCLLLIFSGLIALKNMKPESPLAPYILQILGLTFILPVVILITVIIKVEAQAVMGLLGTIVGYIFGTSHVTATRITHKKQSDEVE
jgi:hypothetical protein